MVNAKRYDTTKPLDGEYYKIVGIPTYIARFRRLGPSASPNYELIKITSEDQAMAKIELDEQVFYDRFQPIASSSRTQIIREARDLFQNDLSRFES